MAEAPSRVAGAYRSVRSSVSALGPRELAREIVAGFREDNLLVEASGMAFRVLLALIPCILFLLGLLGFLGLDEVWREDIAPDLRGSVSAAAYRLIDDTAVQVLTQEQGFWVTLGAAIAVWEVSGIVRAVWKILDGMYGVHEKRSSARVFIESYLLGAAVGILLLSAIVVVRAGTLAFDALFGSSVAVTVLGAVVRWGIALGLLLVAVGLMVRTGSDAERPFRWVSFGALVVVVSWAVMTALFGLYLTEIADYGSVFGNLATVFVLIEYLYLSSVVFVGGLLVDRLTEQSASR